MKFSFQKLNTISLTIALSFGVQSVANAKAGDLDNTFGQGGRAAVGNVGGQSIARVFSLGLTSDGKILFGGTHTSSDNLSATPIVGQLNSNGSIDTNYGNNGVINIPSNNDFDFPLATRIVLDAQNNSYVLIGSFDTVRPRIYKIKPNGTLDTSFGENGVANLPGCHPSACDIEGLTIDSAGRLLVTGSINNFSAIYAGRLLANGQPDNAFGNAGWTSQFTSESGVGWDIKVDEAHRHILISGATIPVGGGVPTGAFVAYLNNENGIANIHYGTNGLFISKLPGRAASDISVLSDGSALLTGRLGKPDDNSHAPSSGFSVWKLTPQGILDTTFGTGGAAFNPSNGDAVAMRINGALYSTILVAGAFNGSGALGRFTSDGRIDTLYGNNGIAAINSGTINDLAVQPDGKAISTPPSDAATSTIYRTNGAGSFSILAAALTTLLPLRRNRKI